jgi:4-amino-4-deoxy-L-arabinose transferase-like glycosyltransferase
MVPRWKGISRDLIPLTGLWLFHVICNAVWLNLDKYPPAWDSAHHLTMTLRWLAFWQSPSLASLKLVAAASSYSPLNYWMMVPFYAVSGRDADGIILASGSIWLAILILATYGLGKQVHGRRSGLLAAAIVSFYPIIVALERDFLLDLSLAAMVTLSLWLLLRCVPFDRRGWAIALGLSLGLGNLIKWPFLIFMAAPLLAALFQISRQKRWSRARLTNLAICLIVGGSLVVGRYLFSYLFLPKELYNWTLITQLITGFAQTAGHPPWYTLSGLIYYGVTLVNHQVTFLFALLFLASIPAFLREGIRGRLILSLSIGVPFVLATLLPVKEQRYTVPYLPVIAVISAIGLNSIRRASIRTAVIILVLVIGLFQFFASSFGVSILPSDVTISTRWAALSLFDQHPIRSPRDFNLQPGDWRHYELIQAISADVEMRPVPDPIQVVVVANTAAYNPNTLNYYSILHDSDLDFLYVWSWVGDSLSLQSAVYPYLVIKDGENTELGEWDRQGVEQAKAYLASNRANFDLIYTSILPDGSNIELYRRIGKGPEVQ